MARISPSLRTARNGKFIPSCRGGQIVRSNTYPLMPGEANESDRTPTERTNLRADRKENWLRKKRYFFSSRFFPERTNGTNGKEAQTKNWLRKKRYFFSSRFFRKPNERNEKEVVSLLPERTERNGTGRERNPETNEPRTKPGNEGKRKSAREKPNDFSVAWEIADRASICRPL